ncbi:myo-inosose-2 dehydratase [Elstera sp.]|jgi:inosose dehydratase/3D-(3,5/4)-trihydroxycyclohexane-1,2-dione acylhydrolase (decyclizing)|uniref:myo-inosose-2 dehydratase n=1 Tax=Elstera sp. TaxID=1916664 RepID=UPI0037BFD5FE
MSVRLGTNPIAWSNDDLRALGGATPLETCLTEARQAGFTGIELGHKFPRAAGPLKTILRQHDIALVSGWYSSELLVRDAAAELEAIRPHLDLLKAMGCSVLIFAETSNAIHGDQSKPLSARPKLAPGDWAEFGKRVTQVADAVAAEGLTLVYHHHMGTVIESEADIDAFMAATGPSVGLLLDAGHATFAGADPVALAKRYRARIHHVHCKDVRRAVMESVKARDTSFLDAVVEGVFTVPGDGCVDFAAVLRELPGYAGWLVVEAEQDPEKANPLTYAKLGHANLKRFAEGAGLL